MLFKDIYSWIYILIFSAMLAIGRIYDERLEILGVNFSIILSSLFIIFSIPLFYSLKSIEINPRIRYLFGFLSLVFLSPLLWLFFGATDYGFEKYINFIFVVIPLVLISSKFKYEDVIRLFRILLNFIFFFALIGVVIVGDSGERLSALGGGPIVFARWMIIGIIIVFFLKKRNIKNIFFIVILFLLSIAAGSRGPVLSLLLTVAIFLLLNFQKFAFRTIIIGLISSVLFLIFDGLNVDNLGKSDRLVTKDNSSKNARLIFAFRSLELLSTYPTGVGIGNWQEYSNKIKPHHLLKHEYPHNLILEVFAELGFIGGVLLLVLLLKSIYSTFVRMLKYSGRHSIYELLFYLQLFLLFSSLFSGSLNDSRFLFVIISISLITDPLLERSVNEK